MKRFLSALLAVILVLGLPMNAKADSVSDVNQFGDAYLVFGADLSAEQKDKVLELLDVSEEEYPEFTQLEVTNKEEHQYLDAYLEAKVIGKHAYSSIKLIPLEEGSGLTIKTCNINFCTASMYKNALITAGMKDADLTVAGPFEISGTAALIGAVKAYADSKGLELNEEALETATNELVLTGELNEEIGDSAQVSELIAYVKQQVVSGNIESEADIREVVTNGAKKMNIDLTDAQTEKIVKLMQKIRKLDIDPEALEQQAKDVYDKLKDMGLDFDSVDVQGFWGIIKRFFDAILDFFLSLFG